MESKKLLLENLSGRNGGCVTVFVGIAIIIWMTLSIGAINEIMLFALMLIVLDRIL